MSGSCGANVSSRTHLNGTLRGNPAPKWITGMNRSALSFDGNQNYASVPNNATLYPQGSFTLEGWLKTTLTCSSHSGGGYLGTLSANEGYTITINGDSGQLAFYGLFQQTGMIGIGARAPVADGNWHHFAVTWDCATRSLSVFTDGVLGETKRTSGPLVISTSPFMLGRTPNGFPQQGPIAFDEVRISNVVRYKNKFTPATSVAIDANTLACWTFDR